MSAEPIWWSSKDHDLLSHDEIMAICDLPEPEKLMNARGVIAAALQMGGITPREAFLLETVVFDAAGDENYELYHLPSDTRYFEAARRFGWIK